MALAPFVDDVLGGDIPLAVKAYDGSTAGPDDAPTTLVVRSPDALRRIITAPGELGIARAYVAGDLDIDGDIWALLDLRDRMAHVRLAPRDMLRLVSELGGWREVRRLAPPREEARLHGRRHSPARDAAAISHHYDVSNAFYRLVLGPSLTYSCAVFHDAGDTLEQAQANKYELICAKLGLEPGMRLLDVGCGWGGMVLHAAEHHGVRAVGVTISKRQAELAEKRAVEAGLSDRVEIRVQDYRDVDDGPFDAVSSIGMFEHVGEARLSEYFRRLRSLLRPGGRLLNHGISHPPGHRARLPRRSFINRYVFPDGELHEVGRVTTLVQESGFEVRHLEALREHYALTLRRWVANLEAAWGQAVDEVGEARARVWRLYMAASAVNFEKGRTQIHQILVTPTTDDGDASMPLRPVFG
ncbi:MAG TPA: cyclopropane-fatty-acyl-phospholipid synthase family protein [Acidimicrobiales bacterium]